MEIIPRNLEESIEKQKNKFPVLAVTGPRQSGKTTLLKYLFKDYRYISLENPDNRAFASEDPVSFLDKYNERVILDEAQRVPELFSYIQGRVDESGGMGQYILSGSQNFHLMNSITQSLAGRVALFKLLPFDFNELKSRQLLADNYYEACIRGFYPAIYHRQIEPSDFYANYIQTYIEKDVTQLVNVRDISAFRLFTGLCASRAGQLLNLNALANDCNISQPTARAWLSILESSYIVFQLHPYFQNFNKRLIKTPKLYFHDTGLLCHLLGIRTPADLEENRQKGNIFENMIVAEFQKANEHQYLHKQYYFWQDSNANEVDVLEKHPRGFDIYEIKASKTITPSLFRQLDFFQSLVPEQQVRKVLIYGGSEDQKRTRYDVRSWQNATHLD